MSKSTVERSEAGRSIQLSSLIRLCRVLDLVGNFDALVPAPLDSPIQQLERAGRTRQRASERPLLAAEPWEWGPE